MDVGKEYFKNAEKMLLNACQPLRTVFLKRWKETTGMDWESCKDSQSEELVYRLDSRLIKSFSEDQTKLLKSCNLDDWDLSFLSLILQHLEFTKDLKPENDGIKALHRIQTELANCQKKTRSREQYNDIEKAVRGSLQSLKFEEDFIEKFIESAGNFSGANSFSPWTIEEFTRDAQQNPDSIRDKFSRQWAFTENEERGIVNLLYEYVEDSFFYSELCRVYFYLEHFLNTLFHKKGVKRERDYEMKVHFCYVAFKSVCPDYYLRHQLYCLRMANEALEKYPDNPNIHLLVARVQLSILHPSNADNHDAIIQDGILCAERGLQKFPGHLGLIHFCAMSLQALSAARGVQTENPAVEAFQLFVMKAPAGHPGVPNAIFALGCMEWTKLQLFIKVTCEDMAEGLYPYEEFLLFIVNITRTVVRYYGLGCEAEMKVDSFRPHMFKCSIQNKENLGKIVKFVKEKLELGIDMLSTIGGIEA